MKCSDRKTLLKILKENGFVYSHTGKHETWRKGDHSVVIPHKTKGFSRMLAERLLKEAGIK